MKMQLEIRFKKCGISNQPDVCIFDDPCLSKFGALRGSCPHPGRQWADMHPSDCPNVEETRNPMQTFSRKKCSHFSPTNIPAAFPHEIPKCILIILLIKAVKDNKQDDVSKELDT